MNIENRKKLIEEAIEIIRFSGSYLGDGTPEEEVDSLKESAIALLKGLSKEQVEFSQRLGIYRLTQEDYPVDAMPLSSSIANKMRESDFYRIDIPITLWPAKDWAFSSLACNILFCPDEEDSKQIHSLPTIHDIFPSDEHQELLNIEISLNLIIDWSAFFAPKVEEVGEQNQQLGNSAQAQASAEVSGGGKAVFGPFPYKVSKALVKSRGRGNNKVFWELSGTKYVDKKDVMLGLVLMVPKSRSKPVNAIGALEAHHDFQILSADLLQFKQFLDGITQQFLEGGASISTTQVWHDITSTNLNQS